MKNYSSSHSQIMIIILLLMSFAALSCEKVVNIDLNSSDPHIVIEAEISEKNTCYVTLSQTVNFDEPNTFPPIRGATITIQDDSGNTSSFYEYSTGNYTTVYGYLGTPGKTYTLTVSVDGKEYVATSTMPIPVGIDSLNVSTIPFGRSTTKVVNAYFQDPPNEKNYYRVVEIHNGKPEKNFFIYDDRVQDGNVITAALFADEDTLRSGDVVQVYLDCIDKGVYDYFRTIRLANGGGGPQAASPANPLSNFSNGALGYFCAHTRRTHWPIIIP